MIRVLLSVLLIIGLSFAKELLTEEKLKQFLTEENPNIFSIVGKRYIYKGKLKYYQGNFDTKLKAKYEKKDYPLSESKYLDFFLEQPVFYGFDVKAGYRQATGVQEYNNIKTSKEGEILLGVSVPIVKVLNQTDERRLNLFKYKNLYKAVDFEVQDKLRKFYLKVLKAYYKAIYYKKVLSLEEKLLEKAKKRISFIKRKIQEGLLPDIYLVEANQHIINRRQRVLKAKNEYENALNELSFLLNIPLDKLKTSYSLPDDLVLPEEKPSLKELMQLAKENRPDIKALQYQIKIYSVEEKFYTLLKYPELNLNLYGTKDFKYDYGFKFTLDLNFYVQRRKYLGKMVEVKQGKAFVKQNINAKLKQIETKLKNLLLTLNTLEQNLKNSLTEVNLVQKLEEAERKKFTLGRSDLFYLNQREIYTLKTKKKVLKYKLNYILTYKEIFITAGVF